MPRPKTGNAPAPSGKRRPGRPAGPTAHGAASRERIIEAAAAEFARVGYEKARMEDLVRATGLTRGAVYFHFDGKESLAVAVLTEKHRQWLEAVRGRIEEAPAGVARLHRLLPAMLDLHRDDPDTWVISRLSYSLADLPDHRDLAAALTRRWIETVADLIRQAQDLGQIDRSLDADLFATVLVSSFEGLKLTVGVLHSTNAQDAAETLRAGGELIERLLLPSRSDISMPPKSRRPTKAPR